MHVTYKPEGGAEQSWDFKPGRVRASEAQVLERVFGGNWNEFAAGVQQGNMRARTVLLWHLFRRDGHLGMRFEDMPDFFAEELEVEFSTDELAEIREGVEKATTLPADRREAMLAGIDKEIAEAMEREGKAATEAVKAVAADLPASWTTPSTDGGSSSPQSSTSLPGESAI